MAQRTGLFASFGHALSGLGFVLRTQRNARFHVATAGLVAVAAAVLQVSPEDWRWIVLAIGLVWAAEAVNTAFERLCDLVQPEFHASVKAAKDVAAGAVLIAAVAAAGVGAMVFWPYLAH